MIEEKLIKEKFNAMCAATAAYKDEIAKTLQAYGHPFYVEDDMREDRNPFVRVIEDCSAIHCVIDMVRSNDGMNIEVHKVSWDFKDVDEWTHIDNIGEEAGELILENILWLNRNDLEHIGGDNHDGYVVDVLNHTNVDLYAVHEDGMVEKVIELDRFEHINAEFCVHRYDWSQAMKELDEYEED